jgi:hypothetical protein
MNVFVCILIYIALIFICIPGVFKKRQWREVVIIFVLLTAGFTLSLLQILGVDVPNPNKGIESLIKLISQTQ